jgi:hypothetical protein
MSTVNEKTGLDLLQFSRQDRQHPIFKRFERAFMEERAAQLERLAHVANIESTTLQRGEIRLLSQILARTSEVGPESRQSEFMDEPESAFPAPKQGAFK